jgi:hypothetical protein
MSLIYFKCVRAGSKLKVRVISPGYNANANCQFPRAIRQENAIYSAPVSDLSFSEMRGKFFYRVKPKNIKIIDDKKIKLDNIYESGNTECVICMENPNEVVLVTCGHYCLCHDCATNIINSTGSCPMCRGTVVQIVMRDQVEF